jgi:hypothetical protein
MAEQEYAWSFVDIFTSGESRRLFVTQCLLGFKDFPPDTKLNAHELNAVMSLMIKNLPFSFVVFVYECVDPTITSANLTHRVAFGNFLLALPAVILFPQFVHVFLALFKTSDRLRRGVIRRSTFLATLHEAFENFISVEKTKAKAAEEEEDGDKDDSDDDLEEEVAERKVEFDKCELKIDRSLLPTYDLVHEVQRATKGLEECSVQTLLFIMWQKNPDLIECKSAVQTPAPSQAGV